MAHLTNNEDNTMKCYCSTGNRDFISTNQNDDNVVWCNTCKEDYAYTFSELTLNRDGMYYKCPHCGEQICAFTRTF